MPSHETLRAWSARARSGEGSPYVHISPDELDGLLEQLEAAQKGAQDGDEWKAAYELAVDNHKEQYGTLHKSAEQALAALEDDGILWISAAAILRAALHNSNPASGERVAAGMPSSTSESSGANQSPEESSPSRDRAVIDGGEESHASPLDPASSPASTPDAQKGGTDA